jgi:uncharacterized protein (DUF2147 family)
MTGIRAATILGAGMLVLVGLSPATSEDATGVWSTEAGKARVRISPCGSALCGSVVGLKEPNDPATGQPKTDKFNADAGKRGRPVIGIQMLIGMKPSGTPDKWAGQIYNAEDGKTYAGSIAMMGASSLKVEGCVMGGMICKSQTWTRAN